MRSNLKRFHRVATARSRRTGGNTALSFRLLILTLVPALLTACTNNPYRPSERNRNFFYSTFSEPPKHLDPAVAYSSDEYDFILQVYEPPLQYHFLIRPYKLIPLTATELPTLRYYGKQGKELPGDPPAHEVVRSVYTVKIREGILYQNHPCFAKDEEGRYLYHHLTEEELKEIKSIQDFPKTGTRELTAADYVYQMKRFALPTIDCPILSLMANYIPGLTGLSQELQGEINRVRDEARRLRGTLHSQEAGERDSPIRIDLDAFALEGVRVVDRYTYEVTLNQKYPQFLYWLAMPFFSPVPREVDLFFGQTPLAARNLKLDNSPVGTGPFRMEAFLPNREISLVRNENFRGETYPDQGEPGDRKEGLLEDAGEPIPFIEKAIYKKENEAIPRWNKFLQGYYDTSGIMNEVFDQAVQMTTQGELGLSDNMSTRGVRMLRAVMPTTFYFAFNMLDDVVGGTSKEKQKLRQAISIAVNIEEWIQIFFNGRGVAAQNLIPPGIFGYQRGQKGTNPFVYEWSEKEDEPVRRSVAYARQLLTEAGYPGGRDREGKPLILYFDTSWTGASAKPRVDWLRKQFAKLNIDLQVRQTDYNRFRDKVKKGNYQILFWGWNADYPDPENFLFLLYGPNGKTKFGGENVANYDNAAFNRLFRQMESMPNSRERLEILDRMLQISEQDAPFIWGYHPVSFSLYHRWYRNAKPMAIGGNTLKYKRIEPKLRENLREAWNKPIGWPVVLLFCLLLLIALPAAYAVWSRQRKVDLP